MTRLLLGASFTRDKTSDSKNKKNPSKRAAAPAVPPVPRHHIRRRTPADRSEKPRSEQVLVAAPVLVPATGPTFDPPLPRRPSGPSGHAASFWPVTTLTCPKRRVWCEWRPRPGSGWHQVLRCRNVPAVAAEISCQFKCMTGDNNRLPQGRQLGDKAWLRLQTVDTGECNAGSSANTTANPSI